MFVVARSPRTRWIVLTTLGVGFVWTIYHLVLFAMGENPPRVDLAIVEALRSAVDSTLPRGPRWVRSIARDITALGGPALLTMWVLLVCGYLILRKQYRGMLLLLASTVGGVLVAYGLKGIIQRPRPPFGEHGLHPLSSSFPSGHATMAAVVYLTIAVMLVRLIRERRVQRFVVGAALVITALVGLSRVYLAAHYPTDVLAGWLLGSAWALLCALVARSLQRTRQLEAAQ